MWEGVAFCIYRFLGLLSVVMMMVTRAMQNASLSVGAHRNQEIQGIAISRRPFTALREQSPAGIQALQVCHV